MSEEQQPLQQRHVGLIVTLIIIIIFCIGVMLYLLNLLPSQVADLVIKPTTQVTSTGAKFVEQTARSISDLGAVKKGWPDDPFSPAMANHVWRVAGDDIFGIEFDSKGNPMYFVHGIKGTYSFDDVPLDGEHVYWNGTNINSGDLNAIDPGSVGGYWLRYRAIRDIDQSWGKVLAGQVDYKYRQIDGHGVMFLNKSFIKKSTNTNASR